MLLALFNKMKALIRSKTNWFYCTMFARTMFLYKTQQSYVVFVTFVFSKNNLTQMVLKRNSCT